MARKTDPPGFRFHPTDEELVVWYLKRKVLGKSFLFEGIPEIERHEFGPEELKAIAEKTFPESRNLEWYFFCRQSQKYDIGSRIDRSAKNGSWKSTGIDKPVLNDSGTVGMRKTLVFYRSKKKTNWFIYEYRLAGSGIAQDSYVLCKIFEKSGPGPKNGEQYGAPFKEEDWDEVPINGSFVLSPAANDMPLPPGPVNDQTIVISEKEPNPSLEHDPQTSGVSGVEEQSDSPPIKKQKQSPSPKILAANDIPLQHELMINPTVIVAMKEPNSLLEHDPQPSGVSTMEEQSHSPENPPSKYDDIGIALWEMSTPDYNDTLSSPENDYNERSEAYTPHGSTDGFLADHNNLGDISHGYFEWNDLCQPMETGASGLGMSAATIENRIHIHNQSIPVGDPVFPAPATNNQYPIFKGSNSSAGQTMMDTECWHCSICADSNISMLHDAYVLCKFFEKSGPGPKNGEQYGAPFKEEDCDEVPTNGSSVLSPAANDMPLPPGLVNDQTTVISEEEPNPSLEHDPQTSGVSGVEEQSGSPPIKKRKRSPSPKILVANDIPLPHDLMIDPTIIVTMKEPNSLLEHDPQPSGEQSHSPENPQSKCDDIVESLEMLLMTDDNDTLFSLENDDNERSEAPNGSTDGFLAGLDGDWMSVLRDLSKGFFEWNDLHQPMDTGASGSGMFAANFENQVDINNQSIPVGDSFSCMRNK